MHGCASGSMLVVNAERDSMGGVIDSRVGISSTPSPQQSSDLEKTQAELRQTFTAAEKFRRELEFLQKGGDPLDLKPGNTVSISFQSTSLTDQHPEQFVTSEAKGSFVVTASPHGDSVESSGRLGAPSVCEQNSADNLMLFDGDNKFQEIERRPVHPRTNNNNLSKHHSQLDIGHITKKSGDPAVLELPKKSYKRRIRSRPNRDGARSSSTDASPSRGSHSFLHFRHASRDFKGLLHDADNQEQNCLLNSNSKPKSPNASVALKSSNSHLDNELDGVQVVQSMLGPVHGPYSAVSDANASQKTQDHHHDQPIKSDSGEAPITMASTEPESVGGVDPLHLTGSKCPPHADMQIAENLAFPGPTNGMENTLELKSTPEDGNSGAALPTKVLDSESSCTQTGQWLDDYDGNRLPISVRSGNYAGTMEQSLGHKEVPDMEGCLVTENNDKISNIGKANSDICHPSHGDHGPRIKEEEGPKGSESALQTESKHHVSTKGVGSDGCTVSKSERKPSIVLGTNSASQAGSACSGRHRGSNDTSFQEATFSVRHSTDVAEQNACSQNNLKPATKEREDSILEEARIIEAKRKRIAELSVRTLPLDRRLKSHWDFVLEEMSWLANDFAQERLWKVTAAAQISRRVAFASRVTFQQRSSLQKQKEVAHTLAEAVMEFWHMMQVKCREMESESLNKGHRIRIQGYAMRFLEYNSSQIHYNATQAPVTADIVSDLGVMDISWDDNLTEENLFYTVPPGAIEAYRRSVESHMLQCERTGSSMQEEVDTSVYDAVADNAFEEDEGETSTYYLPGVFEGSKSSKTAQKRRKNFKTFGARSYEMGGDLSFMQSVERPIGTQPSVLSGKRPASSLNVSVPTKRVRTASRQRVISPFNAGTSGCIQAPNRKDASSGDTNSFQDEQSTLHGGSQIPNNMEAESVGDYEKQLQFDSMEVSNRPKKKKKAKHPASTFEHRWQLDSNFQNDQKDHSRRRLDAHQFDSNGSSVASQMSNMSNPNKFMKLLVRDRGRKAKALKTPAGQPGAGSPWSLFEDQALVVLVHDMGPNWELISDAINSTLQFKCIFRKSKECKERHKILMDRNTGDGADSAEDSGSSQPYPSTLPGIPEGSARQLFQRLQGPMEEDTLKSHFEKIIMIGQKQHYRRSQNDNQDPKQLQQPHSSHAFALSQVCPNNLNGGPVLTPLELCEAISSSQDVLPVAYQGPHSGGLPILNHSTVAPMLPGSGSTSSAPGSSNSVHGSNLPSSSASLNPSVREGRYVIPRTGSLSVDDQQRMQQYNQLLSARNMQQSSLPPGSHSVADRGVRMLPAGSGMGVMCGMNRSMKMARPGYQGIASPSMLSSGSILSSGTATTSPANMNSGAGPGPGQGNSVSRPRDAMHMNRPNQKTEHQRVAASQGGSTQGVGMSSSFPTQISQPPVQTYPLHQQQASPISPQQSPHVLSSNPHHPHHFQGPPNHATNTQHPAYGMRFVKERQLQQQRLLQQQQFSASSAMPHVQPQESQLPVSSPQTSMQTQSSSPPVSLSPMGTPSMTPVPQHPHKHPVPSPHGLVRNPQASGNQMVKQQRQRQSQQFQQPDRQHHQQRQQAQSQQQPKLTKGVRGTMMMHQNLPTDPSLLNGFSGGQSTADKGERQAIHHLLQSGHGNIYNGSSGLNPVAQAASKQSVPHSSLSQSHPQKTYSGQMQAASAKQLQQQKPSHSSDNSSNQNQPPSVVASSSTPSVETSSNHHHHQPQPHQKMVNQTQAPTPKMLHNQKGNPSDQPTSKLQTQAELPMSLNHSSKTSTSVPTPEALCNDATSGETPVVSSAAGPKRKISEALCDSSCTMPDNATQFGKNSLRTSPPQTSSSGRGPEHSEPAVNEVVVHRQYSSDSLSNPGRHEMDVQWQQQSPS